MPTEKLPIVQPLLDLSTELNHVSAVIAERVPHDIALLGPIGAHIFQSPGKRIRTKLVVATAQFGSLSSDLIFQYAAAVELLHAATLLHDDVIDGGTHRRGRPSAPQVWGNTPAILTGDYLFTQAFALAASESVDRASLLNRTAMRLIEGEALQYLHRGDMTLSIETYLRIIGLKTAELFALASIIGTDTSWAPALQAYGYAFGMVFQLRNDQKDFGWSGGSGAGPIGTDLRAKQITLPMILSYQKGTPDARALWDHVMREEMVTSDHISTALTLMEQQGIPSLLVEYERHYYRQSLDALGSLPETPLFKAQAKEYLIFLLLESSC